jgi:hypothetical protein
MEKYPENSVDKNAVEHTVNDQDNNFGNTMVNCPTVLAGMSHELRTHMNANSGFLISHESGMDVMKQNEKNSPTRYWLPVNN